jgi:hypothetical protein
MCISFNKLSHEQQLVVQAIFANPPRSNISWFTVLTLFKENGMVQFHGSFICITVSCDESYIGVFPFSGEQECIRPHIIQYLRDYLCEVGVQPE